MTTRFSRFIEKQSIISNPPTTNKSIIQEKIYTNKGWLVNDCLTCIPGTKTFWHDLLDWFPDLEDKTNRYTDYSVLANVIESLPTRPKYIIRNGTYFRKLNIDVPTICLIQDIQDTPMQIEVINSCSTVVFNSEYVYQKYRDKITNTNVNIISLGVNFSFFKPELKSHLMLLPNSLIYIGSSANYPKGFNIMLKIIETMENQNFCLVMKDDFSIENIDIKHRHRVKVFNKVNAETVKSLINGCSAAICTSYEETQHLSGIECGACNKPIIARAVGIYYDCRDDNEWGVIADDTNFVEKIRYVLDNISSFNPREYFSKKYSTEVSKYKWINLVNSL